MPHSVQCLTTTPASLVAKTFLRKYHFNRCINFLFHQPTERKKMAAQKRIYLVTHPGGKQLVRAPTASQATASVVRETVKCAVATPDEIIECTKDGIEVRDCLEPAQAGATA